MTNHSPPPKRYRVFSVRDGSPHECIAEYNTLDELWRHPQRADAIDLVEVKAKMYVPLREYLSLMSEKLRRARR